MQKGGAELLAKLSDMFNVVPNDPVAAFEAGYAENEDGGDDSDEED